MVEKRTDFSTRRFLGLNRIPNLSQAKLKEAERKGSLILEFGVVPIPPNEEETISAMEAIARGDDIDFELQTSVPNGWREMMNKKNSLFLNSFFSMFRGYPGEQAQRAITILNDDLKRFKVDKDFLHSSEVGAFLFRLTFGVYAHNFIGSGSLLNMYVENNNTEDYKKTIESQMTALRESFANLTADDLGVFIRLEDIFEFYGLSSLFTTRVFDDVNEAGARFVGEKLGVLKGAAFVEALAEHKEKENGFRMSLIDEDEHAWNRLRKGWTEKQVSAVVSLLPQLKSPLVIFTTMLALEDNLSFKNNNKGEWVRRDAEGLLFLLKWKWNMSSQMTHFIQEYPGDLSRLEETIDFPGFSVPNKHLPSTAIALIGNLSENIPGDEFIAQLRDIHNLIVKDKQAATPWFLALAVLKNRNPLLSDLIDEIVGSLIDSLPEAVAETFLNKYPGKIWLRPDSKLFVAKSSKKQSSAFPVFTSLMEEIVVKEPEQIHKSGVVDQERSIKIAEVELVPFFGEIGKVDSRETRQVVLDFFEEDRLSLNEGVLSIEFGDLEKEWKMKGNDRELLYINELNKGDKFAEEAKRASIEAVYIHGNTVMIILNKNGILEDSRSIRLGIKGRIDESGLLQIEGMDHTFLGEKEHLFLNNLALHFATQPLFGVSGIPDSIDKDVISKMNGVAASWKDNPLRRINNLPRIERNGGKPYVAVRVNGYKEPVLMCERSVH